MHSMLNSNYFIKSTFKNGRRISNFIIRSVNYILSTNYRELSRIRQLPRYIPFETYLLGNSLKGVDSASFIFSYDEIFKNEIYKFISKSDCPIIVDCGSNIGLSLIYFKQLYPNSSIIAFEPDPKIFQAMTSNIKSFGLNNITPY